MRFALSLVAVLPLLLFTALSGWATENTPPSLTGLWQTISDIDGKPRGLVQISEKDGLFQASILRSLVPGEDDLGVCDLCPGARRGQPLKGMLILTGLKQERDSEYAGGEILDPDSGRVYRCQARLEDHGRKLIVRGYIGISLFGRSQLWLRAEPPVLSR